MLLSSGYHLTYCTNIHAGEEWKEHFATLQQAVPVIKKEIAPYAPFGIGLRLSNKASLALAKEENIKQFKDWLKDTNCYVYTMNGFPYGSFHRERIKDQVHAPDWTTNERLQYTLRMFRILADLLPEGMEGSISTSPLSYKHWFAKDEVRAEKAMETSTWHILQVVEQLVRIHRVSGQLLHLDLEPEADGLIESGTEFLHWYQTWLLPMGIPFLVEKLNVSEAVAEEYIKSHLRICYDVCHFAVGYEDAETFLDEMKRLGIRVGKIQLSAALKAEMPSAMDLRKEVMEAFQSFNEPFYLHQVVARQEDGLLLRYADLPEALEDGQRASVREWRAHFHVPLFVSDYGFLQSTQAEIEHILQLCKRQKLTEHLEVETYTWEVLPEELRLPLNESISRELQWVLDQLKA